MKAGEGGLPRLFGVLVGRMGVGARATAAPGPAEQFILFAASGMIGNQRLEHPGEPRGKPFGSDTLGGDAGALAYQENFVGETLGIGEPGITAQAE